MTEPKKITIPAAGSSKGEDKHKSGGGLKAEWRKHPGQVLGIAAVGVVVLIALVRRNAASAAGGSGSTGADMTGTVDSSGVQGVYDSSASDVYNQLEDQLSTLQNQIWQTTTGSSPASGTSTGSSSGSSGSSSAGPTAKSGFYRDTKSGNVYEVEGGKRYGVTGPTLSAYLKSGKQPKPIDRGNSVYELPLQNVRV